MNQPPESVDTRRVEQFMALYSGHQRRLYLYTLALIPAASDAEDVFQDANLVLWQKFGQYQEGTNFFAWACKIIRYKVLQHREKVTRAAAILDPDVLDRLADVAATQLEHRDDFDRQILVDCVAKLNAADQELMRQRYTLGMAVQAIAVAMKRSPNAISQTVGRVRRLLLACINKSINDAGRAGGGQ
jgi:RNA polymerase sigma-70 factor (ECF subfamily)